MEIRKRIEEMAARYEDELIAVRRKLHQNAELSMKEFETSRIIAEELKKCAGVEVFTQMAGGTGVVGILRGKKAGKCILLRADIDALGIEEKTDLSFKSLNPGCMHACGHDAHAAWVLGAAKILSELQDEVPGVIKFVFQPGEERGCGAKELIEEDKILENPQVDCAFSAHAWPSINSGEIGIAQKYAFGCPAVFRITVYGQGGHGSTPHNAVNPIMVSNQICTMFSQILSDRINGMEPRVISVCSFMGGSPNGMNVIPEECRFQGTVRSTKMTVIKEIEQEMEAVVKSCCQLYNAKYKFEFYKGIHEVENNSELVDVCMKAAKNILGDGNVSIVEAGSLGGDNFSEFSRRVPSVYMYAGVKDKTVEEEISIHNPQFTLDESSISKVAAVLAEIVYEVNRRNVKE